MPETIIDIINRCKNKDTNSFRLLVEHFQQYAYSLAFRLLTNEEDARDLVQESFIRVWKHIHKYDANIKFTTWLYKIITNLCYDRINANKRKNNLIANNGDSFKLLNTGDDSNIEQEFINRELSNSIASLAEELSTKQRAIFVLRDLQGLETKEISEILDMPLKNIKSNLCLARKEIRRKLIKLNLVGGQNYEM